MITEQHESFHKHERKMQCLLYLSMMRRCLTYGCLFGHSQITRDKKSIKAVVGINNKGVYIVDGDTIESMEYITSNLTKNGSQYVHMCCILC